MDIRKDPLVNDHYFHIFSRSIAGFVVFNSPEEFQRMLKMIELYRFSNFDYRYARFQELQISMQTAITEELKKENDLSVEIVAYCIMPTHIHFILKQVKDDGISKYMSKILNSYAKYFNAKHHRSGPLWDGKFKNVAVKKDEQLLHVTRYLHLNPTSLNLVSKPEQWHFSSYWEYLDKSKNQICNFKDIITLDSQEYQKFVNDRKVYQRELSIIKNCLIDDHSG